MGVYSDKKIKSENAFENCILEASLDRGLSVRFDSSHAHNLAFFLLTYVLGRCGIKAQDFVDALSSA